MLYQTYYDSPLGVLELSATDAGLTRLCFQCRGEFDCLSESACSEKSVSPNTIACSEDDDPDGYRNSPVLQKTRDWLDAYFGGGRPSPKELALAPEGSPFAKSVWELLCEIPYGTTTTYGELSRIIAAKRGGRMSAQAVGGAVGHNPIGIIIPCHRVIGSDGSLTGYAAGLDRKVWLLSREGVLH